MKKFVIALMVAATSTIALAQDAGPAFHARGPRADRFAENLNLTDAQKQQMNDLRAADRAQNQQLYADLQSKLQQLHALKQAGDPKAADVKAQIQAMRPQIQAARKASHEAMFNVLTAEQRAELKTARQSRGFGRGQARAMRATRAMRGVVASKLNLTDEQKAQLKQLRETTHNTNEQLFADARAKRQELHSLRRSDDPRAADVKAQLEALRPQLEAARKQQHDEFLNVLTPEQRAQLEQWKAERQSKRRPAR